MWSNPLTLMICNKDGRPSLHFSPRKWLMTDSDNRSFWSDYFPLAEVFQSLLPRFSVAFPRPEVLGAWSWWYLGLTLIKWNTAAVVGYQLTSKRLTLVDLCVPSCWLRWSQLPWERSPQSRQLRAVFGHWRMELLQILRCSLGYWEYCNMGSRRIKIITSTFSSNSLCKATHRKNWILRTIAWVWIWEWIPQGSLWRRPMHHSYSHVHLFLSPSHCGQSTLFPTRVFLTFSTSVQAHCKQP